MEITNIKLRHFKRIFEVDIELSDINVLVGGNDSGKSSVLQGIHFSAEAEKAARETGRQTFPQEKVVYCPTSDFTYLRHQEPYRNYKGSAESYLEVLGKDDGAQVTRTTTIYRGRNYATIGCRRTGDRLLGNALSSFTKPFSIYVPGLAGIPEAENYLSPALVNRGVARGDANLYLRNVLFQIKGDIEPSSDFQKLISLMKQVFPEFALEVNFNIKRDTNIEVLAQISSETGLRPLELAGTGCLQTLQIFSYLILYKPRFLLFDEPDAHLHPDNQRLLAEALQTASHESDAKIIMATHSRTLVRALSESANFIWLKQGEVYKQGHDMSIIPILMDIGALDDFDKLQHGNISTVILTEDTKTRYLEELICYSVGTLENMLIFSYHGSSRIEEGVAIARFLKHNASDCRYIIHLDRDFMTDQEVVELREKYEEENISLYITDYSDIEHYFVQSSHVAELLFESEESVEEWINGIAKDNHNSLHRAYIRKRDTIKDILYKGRQNDAPSTDQLVGSDIPLPPEKRVGKKMLALINKGMHSSWGKTVNLVQGSSNLDASSLHDLLVND